MRKLKVVRNIKNVNTTPFYVKVEAFAKAVSFESMMMQCLFIVMETFRFQPFWPYFFSNLERRNFPFKKIGNESVFAENIFYAFLFYLETIFKNWTSMTSLVAFSNFNQLAKYVQSRYLGIWTIIHFLKRHKSKFTELYSCHCHATSIKSFDYKKAAQPKYPIEFMWPLFPTKLQPLPTTSGRKQKGPKYSARRTKSPLVMNWLSYWKALQVLLRRNTWQKYKSVFRVKTNSCSVPWEKLLFLHREVGNSNYHLLRRG